MASFRFLVLALLASGFFACLISSGDANEATDGHSSFSKKPNVLLVTVDDMNCDSVGAFGCKLEGTTPHIDKLATQGMRFEHAHVQVGNCYPSRNVLLSGRYPHNTGVEGFYPVRKPKYPHFVDLMKRGGYFVGIRGKVSHSTPYVPYAWDADLTRIDGEVQNKKNAHSFYVSTKRGIELAAKAGKPFCLNINISDPHKPFYGVNGRNKPVEDKNVPSKVFKPSEVPVPGFLFDHPQVRKELALYYSSVRRADDCFGEVMRALDESGKRENTIIVFLSDHGMPLPFAKTALWHHSTHTPLIIVWPGTTKAGSSDERHMVSAVDFMPTLLDMTGIKQPTGFDGILIPATIYMSINGDREAMVWSIILLSVVNLEDIPNIIAHLSPVLAIFLITYAVAAVLGSVFWVECVKKVSWPDKARLMPKYFLHVFYPAHLIVLALIAQLL